MRNTVLGDGSEEDSTWLKKTQPTQKLKATLANPTIRRFLIHYLELWTFKTYSNAMEYCI